MTPAEAIDRIREILAQMDAREPDIFGELPPSVVDSDAPFCPKCGFQMVHSGRCFKCGRCGEAGACD